jgi:hypothetical protein
MDGSNPSILTAMQSVATPQSFQSGSAETKKYVLQTNCWGVNLARHLEAQLGYVTLKLEGYGLVNKHPEKDDSPHEESNSDVTEFNFWATDDKSINLHLSFRRGEGKLHIAQWFNGKWHEWGNIGFNDLFGYGSGYPANEDIHISWNKSAQIYNLATDEGGIWHLNMQPLSPTYYVNYKTHPNRIWKASLNMEYKYEV